MTENKVVIHKAKLKKGVTLVVEYTEYRNDGPVSINQTCAADVHKDLLAAFAGLNPHLARLCEQYDAAGVLSDRMEFRGFSVKGEDEKEAVVLTGIRKVNGDRAVILNSPLQRFGEDGEDVGYEQIDDLLEKVEAAKDEVLKYLFEGKHAPKLQGELGFGNNKKVDKSSDDIDDQDDDV